MSTPTEQDVAEADRIFMAFVAHDCGQDWMVKRVAAALTAAREAQAEADAKIAWGMLSNHWGDKVAAAIRAAVHQAGEGAPMSEGEFECDDLHITYE